MHHLRLPLAILLSALAILTGSCGTRSSEHKIVALTVTPATATSTGPVQFTATGQYNSPPYSEVPAQVSWGACLQGAPTNDVSVTTTGIAQCNQGVTGSYTIWANSPTDTGGPVCLAIGLCGISCGTVRGTAELTCGSN